MKNWFRRYIWEPTSQTAQETNWFGFVFSAILIAAVVNILTSILFEIAGVGLTLLFLLLLTGATVVFVNFYIRMLKDRVRQSPRVIIDRPSPARKRGLICMVTPAPTHKVAIDYHADSLEHIWFIATPAMRAVTQELENYCASKGISSHRLDLENEYNSSACYALVKDVFNIHAIRLGLDGDDIVADMTGGTKPMTAAMVLACADLKKGTLEHVATRFVGNEPVGPIQLIQVIIDSPADIPSPVQEAIPAEEAMT